MMRKCKINWAKAYNIYATSMRCQSNTAVDIKLLEKDSEELHLIDSEAVEKERLLEMKRNKSRLKESDRNFLHEQNPYPEPTRYHQGTLKYLRRLYGRYGASSGVDPALCWPTEAELRDKIDYERVAFDYDIMQVAREAKEKRKVKEEAIRQRQQDIAAKVVKMDIWRQELKAKIEKKEAEVNAAKERRERLIEEVRRHFGYTVDPRDEKFKEMLEKKEKEQKKAMKEARKKAKEEKMMSSLLNKKKE